jgi:hypothetical protein
MAGTVRSAVGEAPDHLKAYDALMTLQAEMGKMVLSPDPLGRPPSTAADVAARLFEYAGTAIQQHAITEAAEAGNGLIAAWDHLADPDRAEQARAIIEGRSE